MRPYFNRQSSDGDSTKYKGITPKMLPGNIYMHLTDWCFTNSRTVLRGIHADQEVTDMPSMVQSESLGTARKPATTLLGLNDCIGEKLLAHSHRGLTLPQSMLTHIIQQVDFRHPPTFLFSFLATISVE